MEGKSKDVIAGFMGLFGRDGRIVRTIVFGRDGRIVCTGLGGMDE